MSVIPLVSCIMPTANRRAFVAQAIRYFRAQDYPAKELVILDDGTDGIADLVPEASDIRYVRLSGKRTLGTKRNECIQASRGDLILHWDDDDWMAPERISRQVEALLRAGAEVGGLRRMLFYELATGQTWLYDYPANQRPFLIGGSLLYTRAFWKRSPFPDMQVASDTRFVWSQRLEKAAVMSDLDLYVALIHPGNTSPKNCRGAYWSRWTGDVAGILGSDLEFFRTLSPRKQREQAPMQYSSGIYVKPPPVESVPAASANQAFPLPSAGGVPNKEALRIGYIVTCFPALSETFIRREVLGLCEIGHSVFVYTHMLQRHPLVTTPSHPRLIIRQVPFQRDLATLVKAARDDGVVHLHSSLMNAAHRAAQTTASQLQIPYSIRAYSGHDVFTARDPHLYRSISSDPLCAALIVEDPFMRDWLIQRLGAAADRMVLLANSFDLDLYRRSMPRQPRDRVVILAIARFVEKKGLHLLIPAFHEVVKQYPRAELWLVGEGPEEARLRNLTGCKASIRFLGAMSEAQTRHAYEDADIFCLPCVQTGRGDADGIPTTVLEAMAFELPIVGSNLLSYPHYVRDGREGLLVAPGDVAGITAALKGLCADAERRRQLGQAGRARVQELCDQKGNLQKLDALLRQGRSQRWRSVMQALVNGRPHYSVERERAYASHRQQAIDFFEPHGRLLEVGCGHGDLLPRLPQGVEYFGCDPLPLPAERAMFPFVAAWGEALPFADMVFDAVLFYSVMSYFVQPTAALREAARVLRPGGQLYIHECVNDANPLHLNHFRSDELRKLIGSHLTPGDWRMLGENYLLLRARKPGQYASLQPEVNPLVSIAVTAYNRAAYIGTCIDSVLRQTHRPIEIVVVDDCSTDGTRRLLETYGNSIRIAVNEQNRGIAFSKNRALRMTSSEAGYVGILDSDDYYQPQFVERCVALLQKRADVGLVYTDDLLIDARGRPLRQQRAIEPWNVETWLRTCNLRSSTWLARRDLVMATALHDEALRFDVDYDLFYQLLERTTFAHLPEVLAAIRHHPDRATSNHRELARCHAANLVKYGYSPEYAYYRARHHPEWRAAIAEGIALGQMLRQQRLEKRTSHVQH